MHLFVQGECPAGMAELLSLLIYNGLYSKITAKNMYNTLKFILRLYIVRYITAPKRKILLFRKKVVFLVSFFKFFLTLFSLHLGTYLGLSFYRTIL